MSPVLNTHVRDQNKCIVQRDKTNMKQPIRENENEQSGILLVQVKEINLYKLYIRC